MRHFHPLKVLAKEQETRDSIRLALHVPDELHETFAFQAGQHLPIEAELGGKRLRRTYSICSEPGHWPLEIGIRVQPGGRFSEYAANELSVGDALQVMPPTGRFHANIDAAASKYYLGFAAGSGITPILSIARSVLNNETGSRFALFYGNRRQASAMFIEDLFALKNRYPDRLQLHFVFSREDQEFPINAGRLDREKVTEVYRQFCGGDTVDEVFVCGPDTMIDTVIETLVDVGVSKDVIHAERFGAPRRGTPESANVTQAAIRERSENSFTVTVIMDGHKKSFEMAYDAPNIVDAAAESGIELPYSCKGGVCATCRTHVRNGTVQMAANYGLEPWELEAGFVLACQSRPQSDEVLLDYDKS
ncbi:MAG: 2Fe-2S iron-sulfur cluster-binding protein [Woeseiaceae bacterium]